MDESRYHYQYIEKTPLKYQGMGIDWFMMMRIKKIKGVDDKNEVLPKEERNE